MGICLGTAVPIASLTLVAASHKQSTGLFVIAPCSIPVKEQTIKIKAPTTKLDAFIFGAGDGNRTHTTSLEGWDSSH